MRAAALFFVVGAALMAGHAYAGQNGAPAGHRESVAMQSRGSGLPAEGVILYVPDERREAFYRLVLHFASEHAFVHAQAQRNLRLTDHFFGFDYFERPDGIFFLVTDITRRGKMQIAFYGGLDGASNQQAAELAKEFESGASEYERYPQ